MTDCLSHIPAFYDPTTRTWFCVCRKVCYTDEEFLDGRKATKAFANRESRTTDTQQEDDRADTQSDRDSNHNDDR